MHLKIFGSRNSYSKTDKDASFMRIKEEKNAYSILSVLESKNLKFKNIVADAGYESEEN